ncbi:MAG: hypothetical protein HC883_00415, partial [Bdellovibrionaceae bacterium]|nr:hypothetical protein [Pseudobdellovibrionaceae bacterium]
MRLVLISAAAAALLLAFQNCSEVSFETAPSTLLAQQLEFQSSASIEIDDNAEYTRQSLVKLKLSSVRAVEMKISNLESCTDGVWEPYSTAKVWNLSKGNDKVKAYAQFRDLRGNISGCVNDEIIHDDIAPEATFDNAPGLITNNSVLNLTWKSQDNLSGVDITSCRGPDNVTIPCTNAFTVNTATDGNKTVTVRLVDKAGNESGEFRYSFLFDKTPPLVNINTRPAALTGAGTAVLGFSGSDALAGIAKYSCRLDGAAYQDCTSPMQFAGLTEGPHKFEVLAVDKAGNASGAVAVDWLIDMTAPSLNFTKTPSAISNSRAAEFAYVGVDNNVAITKFDCRADSGAFALCNPPTNLTNLSEGSHSFEVRGYDASNNVSSPIKYQWIVDTTAPVVNITAGPAALTNDTSASFQWTVGDSGSGVKSVE